MTTDKFPGAINGHHIGTVIKEMAERAMEIIARNRVAFVATEKESYKAGQDFFTNADTEAQQLYVRKIGEYFPTYGIIGEEDNLRVPCAEPGLEIYFTVDPLDGTKAFMRRQSHGIGTMIALVQDGVVASACVGDVMTGELYYFRPGSDKVHRFCLRDLVREVLTIESRPLAGQYVLLGDDPRLMSEKIEQITRPNRGSHPPVFKDIEIMGGSIGVKMARLWKGEVAAMILKAGKCTPWDWCPIAGISAKLGFMKLAYIDGAWASFPLVPVMKVEKWDHDSVIIHESNIEEFIGLTS